MIASRALGPREPLKQFLQHEAGREERFAAAECMAQPIDRRLAQSLVPAERQ